LDFIEIIIDKLYAASPRRLLKRDKKGSHAEHENPNART